MAELSHGERRTLISHYVENAQVNWAHVAIAQLLKSGFVDRVLTTNFDPLLQRACAMLNMFPAVYDFASSQNFKPAYTPDRAIFHLHGQHSGFALLNTNEEVNRLSRAIGPVFEDATRKRLWIVVGYSGECDPVFKQLARVKRFDERLYWVAFKNDEPASHVRKHLLDGSKGAHFVQGFDADEFFVTLAQRLDCFPPEWIEKPFTHLKRVLDSLTTFGIRWAEPDVGFATRAMIDAAINKFEEGHDADVFLSLSRLLAGRFDKLKAMRSPDMSPTLAGVIARGYAMAGTALADQAKRTAGPQAADQLFGQADEEFAEALKLSPNMHEAFHNWGNSLAWRAKRNSGPEGDALLREAGEKYTEALAIKPDEHEVLSNWGTALAQHAGDQVWSGGR